MKSGDQGELCKIAKNQEISWKIIIVALVLTLRSFFCLLLNNIHLHTVNVEIFGQYIFSRILRKVLDVRKYNMSQKFLITIGHRINY